MSYMAAEQEPRGKRSWAESAMKLFSSLGIALTGVEWGDRPPKTVST